MSLSIYYSEFIFYFSICAGVTARYIFLLINSRVYIIFVLFFKCFYDVFFSYSVSLKV